MRADDGTFRITVECGHVTDRGEWRPKSILMHRITMTTDNKEELIKQVGLQASSMAVTILYGR